MNKRDIRIDKYVENSAEFSKPILNNLRSLIHKVCPEVKETMKWSFPHFDYKDEMMCSMAAFKQHCAFGFRKADLIKFSDNLLTGKKKTAMGNLGRICSMEDLPNEKSLENYIMQAMKLNDDGVRIKINRIKTEKKVIIPEYFRLELVKNKRAKKYFDDFSVSKKCEYIEWITDAKSETTRTRRISTSIKWISEGKIRNWKYLKK